MEKVQGYAVGKRKTSVAKVFLLNGSNKFIINDKTNFFNENDLLLLKKPFFLLNINNNIDTLVKVSGGGIHSQLEAIFLGICKALSLLKNEYRQILSKHGFLKRDSRIKERRKYGLKKARKASQYSKR